MHITSKKILTVTSLGVHDQFTHSLVTEKLIKQFITSLSSKRVVVVMMSGCTEKCFGLSGICCKILYFRQVCRVSGSSRSIAVTFPTEVPVK